MSILLKRFYSAGRHAGKSGTRKRPKFSLRGGDAETGEADTAKSQKTSDLLKQPDTPIRARFAPSPTGFLHLGSLRTALYNYLAARSTGGDFLLRLEDTDQNRLVPGAEENIYDTMKWLGITIDEGPPVGGPHAPYRQSERSDIYRKYVDQLIESGSAYRCFCEKDRLDQLRDSARRLKPPTTASYDRHCLDHYSKEESDRRAANGEKYTVRLKSPEVYPPFVDLLHGNVCQQVQVNPVDRRYDDPVLMKSDGLPTYHFANVVDDHLMKITHVIRGEEWLPSTPKHIALYKAFGWQPPKFIHIPLLTTVDNKKLSKRKGDIDIMSFKKRGYLPEALVNFAVLFGWAPKREYGEKSSEMMDLKELEKEFRLDGLTKGNAKVDFKKLDYFNKHYLAKRLDNPESQFFKDAVDEMQTALQETLKTDVPKDEVDRVLRAVGGSLTKLDELNSNKFWYFFEKPKYSTKDIGEHIKLELPVIRDICQEYVKHLNELVPENLGKIVKEICEELPHDHLKNRHCYQLLRYALSGPHEGINMHTMMEVLGKEEVDARVNALAEFLSKADS